MTDKKLIDDVKVNLDAILIHTREHILHKNAWNDFTFSDEIYKCINNFFTIAYKIHDFDFDVIPDITLKKLVKVLQDISRSISCIDNCRDKKEISEYIADKGSSLIEHHDIIYDIYCKNAFLASTLSKNVDEIKSSVSEIEEKSNILLEEYETLLQKMTEKLDKIKIGHANYSIGKFQNEFAKEAESQNKSATIWLSATCAFGFIICVVCGFFLKMALTGGQINDSIFILTTKAIIFFIFFYAILWCGRMYKTARHLAIINTHKANALTTFQTFINASDDPQTKDAVLLETTRSIFSLPPTGFLGNADPNTDGSIKILEIVKQLGKQKKG